MEFADQFKAVLVLGPILGLLTLGLAITLGSGVASPSSPRRVARFAGNLSLVLVRVAGLLVALLVVQRFIGAPFGWSL